MHRLAAAALSSLASAAALATMLASPLAPAEVEVIPVTSIPPIHSDLSINLSGDGTTVLRTFVAAPGTLPIVTRWRQSTGVVVIPPPAPAPWWTAESIDPSGNMIEAYTVMFGIQQAHVYDVSSGVLVPGFGVFKRATVKSGLSRAIAVRDLSSPGAFTYAASGFTFFGAPSSGSFTRVGDVSATRAIRGVGTASSLSGGTYFDRAWSTNGGGPLQFLAIPAGDTNTAAFDVSSDGQIVTGTSWRTLPGGTLAHRLARWTSTGVSSHEPAGGAQLMSVLGGTADGRTVTLSILNAAGNQSEYTIWDAGHGFLSGNEFLALRGYPSSPPIDRIFDISNDGRAVVATLTNGNLVVIRGLDYAVCGVPGAPSCFVAHATPGCSDGERCSLVCVVDPFCCESQWDSLCVGGAQKGCAGCGNPKNGSCFEPHGTTGCSDTGCCTTVCTADPFCCETQWDSLCADRALVSCRTGDTCADAQLLTSIVPASYGVDTIGAPADGITTGCGAGDTIAARRILRAPCSGMATISICHPNGSSTALAMSVFSACGGAEIACSADTTPSCTPSWRSVEVEFFAVAGEEYLIRVSAVNGGTIFPVQLVVNCEQVCGAGGPCNSVHGPGCNDAACCETVCTVDPYCCATAWDSFCVSEAGSLCANPADINGDGVVNGADLSILLGNWGGAGVSDINGDGVTNASDLAIMLANWG
jgi:hypothetical protein